MTPGFSLQLGDAEVAREGQVGSADSLEPESLLSQTPIPPPSPKSQGQAGKGHLQWTILISSLLKKVGSEPLISVWHPPPGPQTNLSPRPHSDLKELGKTAAPTGCFEQFPLPSNSLFDIASRGGWPSAFGGPFAARSGEQREEGSDLCCDKHPFFNWCW